VGAHAIRARDLSLGKPARQATQKQRDPRIGGERPCQALLDAGKRRRDLAMDPYGMAQEARAHLLASDACASVGGGQDRFDAYSAGILVHGVDGKDGPRPVGNAKQILDIRIGQALLERLRFSVVYWDVCAVRQLCQPAPAVEYRLHGIVARQTRQDERGGPRWRWPSG